MDENVLRDFINEVNSKLNNILFARIYDEVERNGIERNCLNPAFPYPKEIRMGIINGYFIIEYCGPEDQKSNYIHATGMYQPSYDVFEFLNVNMSNNTLKFTASNFIENMVFFMDDSITKLCDYFYDLTQIPAECIVFNGCVDLNSISEVTCISNTTLFYTDEKEGLRIRHIDFMEIFPFDDKGNLVYRDDEWLKKFADFIVNYKTPKYDVELHKELNEFIELISIKDTEETEITTFLEQHPQLFQIAFGTHELNPQITLKWQYESDCSDLKPDFMPVRMDGYCDIFEFKLPHIKSKMMVGISERRQPSFEIDSAIAQLEKYEEWCSQEINIRWLKKEKNLNVFKPQKYLIIGHSGELSSKDRRKLSETRNTTILTYDEFIDMLRYQIYRFR